MLSPNALIRELFSNITSTASNRARYLNNCLRKPLCYAANEVKGRWLPLSTYLTAAAGDIITTQIAISKYGIGVESNSLVRYFMEAYDPFEGSMLITTVTVPLILSGALFAAKSVKSKLRKEDFPFDTVFLYSLSILPASAAITNTLYLFGYR